MLSRIKSKIQTNVVISVILMCLVIVLLFVYKKPQVVTDNAVFPSPIPEIEESYENGVYTNSTYGFTFNYPVDKFSNRDETYGMHVYINPSSPKDERIFLSVTTYSNVTSAGSYQVSLQAFEDLYNSKVGRTIRLKNKDSTKLYAHMTDQYRFVADFSKTAITAETEHSVGYRAWWLLEDKSLIMVSMFGDPETSEKFVLANEKTFDKIVDSFRVVK